MAQGESSLGGALKVTAAAIFGGIFLLAALILVWALALQGYWERIDYVGADGEPRLRFFWRTLIWYVSGGTSTKQGFTILIAALAVMSQTLAEFHKRLWSLLLVCAGCSAGIAGSIALMTVIEPGGPVITTLRAFSGGEEHVLRSSIQTFVLSLMGWFTLFLITQLGLKWDSATGVVSKVIDRATGRRP